MATAGGHVAGPPERGPQQTPPSSVEKGVPLMAATGEVPYVPPGAETNDSSPAAPMCDEIDVLFAGQSAGSLEEWDAGRFRFVATLQEAPRNNGRVELCEDLGTSSMVAVKAMPVSWTHESHEAFVMAHPEENELPWRDIGATRHLSQVAGLSCVCRFVGLFRRSSETFGTEVCLVLSYCAGGDLFSWLERSLPTTGPAREAAARPLMRAVFEVVSQVHAAGIAHGDLSLENVLLAKEETDPELADIRLIDFGACTGPRAVGARGKPSYQAPEVHDGQEYDAMAADSFSLGVMVFTLAVGNYPWRSTRPHACPCFKFVTERGLAAYLARRKIRCGDEADAQILTLASLLSPALVSLLSGLLALDPRARPAPAAALAHPWFRAGAGAAEPPEPPPSRAPAPAPAGRRADVQGGQAQPGIAQRRGLS